MLREASSQIRMHGRDAHATASRRDFLCRSGGGFGAIALAHLLARDLAAAPSAAPALAGLHHPAKAKRVIQLFMNGGVSQMDTFDYKPALERLHGQALGPKEKPEGQTGASGAIMKSPFAFKQHGESGRWVSSVFPHQAKHVDDMAFLMAMKTFTNVHGPGSYMMNSGFLLPGFPCMGAWISYGLGSIADNMPTFVVLPDPRGLPYNQKGNFSAGFLPAKLQGTIINAGPGSSIPNLTAPKRYSFVTPQADRDGLELLGEMNRAHAAARPADSRLEARISSYELAAKMQLSAPEAMNLSKESPEIRRAYGLEEKVTEDFGRRCLLARRLIERGVRFVQVWSGPQGASNNWDNHGSIPKELPPIAASVDQPTAALLADLKQRGMLEDTLLIFTTEFGRTPFAQGGDGRDHNGGCFVTWLAGGGAKAGYAHGQSDDWANRGETGVTDVHDLHATILHLLGIDHTKLTVRHNGIDRRLTDVHGKVITPIVA